MKKPSEEYSEAATARFEAALKSAMNTPHTPLNEKPLQITCSGST